MFNVTVTRCFTGTWLQYNHNISYLYIIYVSGDIFSYSNCTGVDIWDIVITQNKSKSKKTLFKVGQRKQYNIGSHLKWMLVADKGVHMINTRGVYKPFDLKHYQTLEQVHGHWNTGVVTMPILSSLVPPEFVIDNLWCQRRQCRPHGNSRFWATKILKDIIKADRLHHENIMVKNFASSII